MDGEERVEALGRPHSFWSVRETEDRGAFVDWDGRPLVLRFDAFGSVVDAQVGIAGSYEGEMEPHENGAELADEIGIDLGAAKLLYNEATERAWLRMEAESSLADACQQVASLAPVVAEALECEFEFDSRPPAFEELFCA